MPDRNRTDAMTTAGELSPADRNSRVEWLLLAGLDHYFAREYERAISAWTRVLFIDRGHARAKAYIDRARGAIAERQRESEELLQRGVAAFDRGEAEDARALLTSAVEQGGPQEVALAFLDRLERLERRATVVEAAVDRPAHRGGGGEPRMQGERRVRSWTLPVLILAVVLVGAVYVLGSRERTAPFQFLTGGAAVGGVRTDVPLPVEPLPVPRPAELDIERAKALLASGHARDALRLVDRVRAEDPLRAEADALLAAIQASLLSGTDAASPPSMPAAAAGVSRHP